MSSTIFFAHLSGKTPVCENALQITNVTGLIKEWRLSECKIMGVSELQFMKAEMPLLIKYFISG
jgi:hypothetical protein